MERNLPEGTIEADLAEWALAWAIGSDIQLRTIILMEDIILRVGHGALEEMETAPRALLKCWPFDLARTAFLGMRPGECVWQGNKHHEAPSRNGLSEVHNEDSADSGWEIILNTGSYSKYIIES